MEAGKRRLAGGTARATTDEVKDPHRENSALKECVADMTIVPGLQGFSARISIASTNRVLTTRSPVAPDRSREVCVCEFDTRKICA